MAAPPDAAAPLAERMRPHTFDEFVGQTPTRRRGVASCAASSRAKGASRRSSSGARPGTRQDDARAPARPAQRRALRAALGGLLRRQGRARGDRRGAARRNAGRRTILFIDEIHRFNKAQQDALLPAVEDGTVTLIGATTENPSFEVIGALLSRSRVLVLEPLRRRMSGVVLRRALADDERGLAGLKPRIADELIARLAQSSAATRAWR